MSEVLRVFYTSFENKRKKKSFVQRLLCVFFNALGAHSGALPEHFVVPRGAPGLRAPSPPPAPPPLAPRSAGLRTAGGGA